MIAAVAASLLAGCGTLKKFTGQRNDSVLPGEREEILTPQEKASARPDTSDPSTQRQCDPNTDPACQGKITDPKNQEGSGSPL